MDIKGIVETIKIIIKIINHTMVTVKTIKNINRRIMMYILYVMIYRRNKDISANNSEHLRKKSD